MIDVEQRLREAHPISQQYANGSKILLEAADEVARLKADNEALRASYATVRSLADNLADGVTADLNATTQEQQNAADHKLYDAHEDYLVFRENNPDTEAKAWLLRREAETVGATLRFCRAGMEAENLCAEIIAEVHRLRDEADAIERGGDHG